MLGQYDEKKKKIYHLPTVMSLYIHRRRLCEAFIKNKPHTSVVNMQHHLDCQCLKLGLFHSKFLESLSYVSQFLVWVEDSHKQLVILYNSKTVL